MKGILAVLIIGLRIQLLKASGDPPVWTTPSTSASTLSVSESVNAGTIIYGLYVTDAENDHITFDIVYQDPAFPVFSPSNVLKIPVGGLDAENTTSFTFRFSANDGTTTVNSTLFTLTVTDVNEFPPVFSPTSYMGSVTDGVAAGTTVVIVRATDNDTTATVSYDITVGNVGNTFAIDSNGVVTVAQAGNIDSATTSSYTLTVKASDGGGSTADATVNITVSADPCTPNPCHNSGTCSPSSSAYVCNCTSEWIGTTCNTAADPCLSQPCRNNGTCTTAGNTATCTCTSGFTGTDCSTHYDPCSSEPCQNNGTCTATGHIATCTCSSGFIGTDCSTRYDPCSSEPCQNNGTCTAIGDVATCACSSGFIGAECSARSAMKEGQNRSPEGSDTGMIIAVVIVVTIVVVGVIIVIVVIKKRKRNSQDMKLPRI